MADQITTLGQKEESLSEQFDSANVTLKADQQKVAATAKAVQTADAAQAKAKGVLRTDAVNAYIHNGTAGASTAGDATLKNANNGLLRAEYVSSLAANQTDDQDAYHLASVRDQTAQQNLQTAQAAAQKQVDALATAKANVQASQTKLQGVYNSETSQIATLVAKIQAQKEAAAQAAATAAANARAAAAAQAQKQAEEQAQAQQAAQESAATTAATPEATTAAPPPEASPAVAPANDTTTTGTPADTSGDTAAPVTDPPATEAPVTDPPTTEAPPTTAAPAVATPPASGVGAGAVAAAETQLGVPYEWGGATPGVGFDCSGLVMWAYAQVGVSLPHFSGAQFSAGVQIPMSDLEPGDLVFFADPGEHVAMYVGGGDIIEAPETGETVHIVPMYSEFVSAVRIS